MQAKAPRGVQMAEVAMAADALLAEGQRPTIERVRLKIGRGSPNTLAPMLEAWFGGLGTRLGLASAKQGSGMPPAARPIFDTAWQSAVELARATLAREMAAERAGLSQERQALQQERSALDAAKAALLAKEKALLREKLGFAEQRLTALQQTDKKKAATARSGTRGKKKA